MGEVVMFDEAKVPAHILAQFGGSANSDLAAGVSTGFPILSFKGKVWHIATGKTRTLVAGPDGEPRQSLEVVIVKSNPHVSKVWYEGGYVEGSTEAPTCYSHDGILPAADVASKQAAKCAICPRNQWGSRITEAGAKGKECSDSRRLAVSPAGELDNPMLLRIPAASLKDLSEYATMLDRRKTPYQAVVTKIGFDHSVAYQKLTFTPVRWLELGEQHVVAATMGGPVVASIIGDSMSEATAAASGALDALGERPAIIAELAAPPVAETPAPTRAQAKAMVSEDDIAEVLGKAAAPAAPAPAPKPAPAPAAPQPTEAQKKMAALKAEMAALEAAAAAPAPEPEAEVKAPRDHSKLLSEASASLDEVLGILDDE